jgi:hypothetical protein
MSRLVVGIIMRRLMAFGQGMIPQPHARQGCHSLTIYHLGTSTPAGLKYPSTTLKRRLSTCTEQSLSENDAKSIQDTFEGFLLMSLLK